MAPPKGRPPLFHQWAEGAGYVHEETGEPFDPRKHKEITRARKSECERNRYWDPTKLVRLRRLNREAVATRISRDGLTIDDRSRERVRTETKKRRLEINKQ